VRSGDKVVSDNCAFSCASPARVHIPHTRSAVYVHVACVCVRACEGVSSVHPQAKDTIHCFVSQPATRKERSGLRLKQLSWRYGMNCWYDAQKG
jgi:hypothetical protein